MGTSSIKVLSTLTLSLLILGLLSHCGSSDDVYNNLHNKLRILAIQADKPSYGPNETTTLKALIYNPPHKGEIHYRWSWCPNPGDSKNNYACLSSSDTDLIQKFQNEQKSANTPTITPYTLGTNATASLDYPLSQDILDYLCHKAVVYNGATKNAAGPCDPTGSGLPIHIRLEISNGEESINSVKEIYLLTDPQQFRNHNPTLSEIKILDEQEQDVAYTVDYQKKYLLRALIPATASETLPDGQTEDLLLTWFVPEGSTKRLRTIFLPAEGGSLKETGENEWDTPLKEDYPEATGQFILVIRDYNGGVNWLTSTVTFKQP